MKFQVLPNRRDKTMTDYLMRRVLYIRYGREDPTPSTPPLVSYSFVASLLSICSSKASSLAYRYFRNLDVQGRFSLQPPKLNSKPSIYSRVTIENLKDEEF
jgi:hypothetical protein